jgi:hypothetical protein
LSAFFNVQLSHPYSTAGKTIVCTSWSKLLSLSQFLSILPLLLCPRLFFS